MRERTTPWRDVVDEDGAARLSVSTGGIGALRAKKLKRVEGGGGEADALTRVELWADEVVRLGDIPQGNADKWTRNRRKCI